MQSTETTALITGASAGIGAEFCRQLAPRCRRITAVARRREKLERLREELGDTVETCLVVADLTRTEELDRE